MANNFGPINRLQLGLAMPFNQFVKHCYAPAALRWTQHCVLRRLQKRYK